MFIWQKDSLLPELNQHQGVFWPDHPNTKEYFGKITPPPKTLKATEFTFSTKESFAQSAVDYQLPISSKTELRAFK